jgi:hypothetical protein
MASSPLQNKRVSVSEMAAMRDLMAIRSREQQDFEEDLPAFGGMGILTGEWTLNH